MLIGKKFAIDAGNDRAEIPIPSSAYPPLDDPEATKKWALDALARAHRFSPAKLAEVLAFYDDYGRGMDGMEMPYQVSCHRAAVVDRPDPVRPPADEPRGPEDGGGQDDTFGLSAIEIEECGRAGIKPADFAASKKAQTANGRKAGARSN